MSKSFRSFSANRYRGGQRHRSRFSRRQKQFNPSLFMKEAIKQSQVAYSPQHSFSDFLISDQLKKNIYARGYEKPTPIQDKVIPLLLEGTDVVGSANSGTGKTAAFLIPLINKIYNAKSSKVLIVAPTRELAMQIEVEFKAFAHGMQLFSVLCIGGASINRQVAKLKRNPHFVIGTPGRLLDLERRNVLHFDAYTTIVLDEVDRMLDMGFIHDMRHMISRLPKKRHSLFFSATIPEQLKALMQSFLTDPITVSIQSRPTSENVAQDVVRVNGRVKIDILHDLLIQEGFEKVLVFGRTKFGMDKLAKALKNRGFRVAAIHGNKTQRQRQRALEQFRDSAVQVLLATDVASRGLDIDNVTHVINFDTPQTYEDYIHRIGRTGRANKTGVALTFV